MVLVGLVACVCNGCARWHDRSVRLCTGLIAIALAEFFLERTVLEYGPMLSLIS